MVMPLPSHLRPPSPVNKPQAAHPRSPVKKHLRESAAMTSPPAPVAKIESPQKLKAVVAQNLFAPGSDVSHADSSIDAKTSGRLRAATLQAVLGLVDRDNQTLRQLLPLLHTLGSLPLEADAVVQQCHQALELIQAKATGRAQPSSSNRQLTSALAHSHSHHHLLPRDSGRAKSAASLKHCKAFLLACTNEIHELEEVNPCFDYAEETPSESASVLARGPPHRLPDHVDRALKRLSPGMRLVFDHGSSVDSSSVARTTNERCHEVDGDDDDDTRADTGSQLSELLIRTVETEKNDRASALSLADRVACRRALHAWRGVLCTRPAARREMATLFRAFSALKRNRAVSMLSVGRKQRAFGRMKALVVARASPQRSASSTMKTTANVGHVNLQVHVVAMLLLHWDVVVLLVVAGAVHFGL